MTNESANPNPAANNTNAGGDKQTDVANTNAQGTEKAAAAGAEATKEGQQTDSSKVAADANKDGKVDADKGADQKSKDAKEGDKAGDDKASKDAAKTAPEQYADFTLPEDVAVNPETIGKFTELAKKHGLTQEAAQEFATLGAEISKGQASGLETALVKLSQEATQKWESDSKGDKEFGGANLEENLAVAKRAVDAYATPELKALLGKFDKKENPNGTGLGNNPEVIRLFYRLGKTISPDTKFVESDTGKEKSGLSHADKLWGKKG